MMRRVLIRYGVVILLALAWLKMGVGSASAAGWTDVIPLSREDVAGNASAWKQRLRVEEGKVVVEVGSIGRYHGSALTLKQPLKIPQGPDEYLHIHFKVYGFSEASGKDKFSAATRIYLTPAPATTEEPYVQENSLICVIICEKGNGTKIELFQKINQAKGGFGELLYSGVMPGETWPMGIDLYLSAETYRLTCDQDIEPSIGTRSGFHALPRDTWSGDLQFGLRVLNYGTEENVRLLFGDFRVGTARHDD